MAARDVDVSAEDAVAMLIARFRDREPTDSAMFFQILAAPAQGVSLEPRLVELLSAGLVENMRDFLTFLSHDMSVDTVAAPPATLEYVRRLAQNGVGVSSLVSALRALHKQLLGLLTDEIRQSGLPRDTALDVFDFFIDRSFGYVDRITEQVRETHEDERERWLERQNTARVLGVRQLLADDGHIDIDAATATIGYPLDGTHLALIVWTAESGNHAPDTLRLEQFGLAVAEALTIDSPLFIAADPSTGWIWLPLPSNAADPIPQIRRLAHSDDGVIRVAVGTIDSGVTGFRDSHRRAQAAREVAVAGRAERGFVAATDPEVRVAALMVDDLDRTRRWVQDTLGPLASNTPGDAKLRETLRIFLREGSSHTAAAEHLALHRNTVAYRVNKAVQRRGRSITNDQIEIEMALLACDQFREAVLLEAAESGPGSRDRLD
jgi:DNA-binding PucR family transcriptional regulator